MKKILILIFINIIIGLLQVSFFPTLFGSKILINWILAFGLSWLLVYAPVTALKSVFIGGLVLDILLGTRLGLSSLIMTSGVYSLILVRSYLFRGIGSHFVIGTLVAFIYYNIMLKPANLILPTIIFSVLTAGVSILLALFMRQILSSRN
jgi:hypothetical protein